MPTPLARFSPARAARAWLRCCRHQAGPHRKHTQSPAALRLGLPHRVWRRLRPPRPPREQVTVACHFKPRNHRRPAMPHHPSSRHKPWPARNTAQKRQMWRTLMRLARLAPRRRRLARLCRPPQARSRHRLPLDAARFTQPHIGSRAAMRRFIACSTLRRGPPWQANAATSG